ncbi:MAG: hypothetical protein ACFBSE_09110 [Prochloraceae cyanobacterium]
MVNGQWSMLKSIASKKPLKKELPPMIDQNEGQEQEQGQLEAEQNSQECLKNTETGDRESKIKYNFRKPHPLLRFVSEETVAFLFAIDVEQIYEML